MLPLAILTALGEEAFLLLFLFFIINYDHFIVIITDLIGCGCLLNVSLCADTYLH